MTLIEKARQLRAYIEKASASLDDADALNAIELYPVWADDVSYVAGDRVRYDGVLYKCLQDHTAQVDWIPTAASSLWAKVLIPDPDVIPEWEQPDSTNPYMAGDKVILDGVIYVSLIDNNVWKPTDYPAGWQMVK